MLKPDIVLRIAAVLDAPTNRFTELVRRAGLEKSRAFRGANLCGADLRNESLTGYDFNHADLSGADVSGAALLGAVGLGTAILTGIVSDADTTWPPDIQRAGGMVLIPPGTFMMGTPRKEVTREKVPKDWGRQEQPRHKVTIRHGFYLDRFPVTRGEFARFIAESGHLIPKGAYTYVQGKGWQQSDNHDWSDPGFPQTELHPVTCVSHEDAEAYANWLSRKTGQRYRLPTEAEWEYACRAGTATARFWGDDGDSARRFANVADATLAREWKEEPDPERFFAFDDGFPFTSPAGSFEPNPFGLYDMLGNVWEWTSDHWHDSYKNAPSDGSAWTTGGGEGLRVLRGASWNGGPWVVRAGVRNWGGTGGRDTNAGFRLARTL